MLFKFILLFIFLEGRQVQYAKISQLVKETFSQLISAHSQYLKCSSSLAAFVIERGKSIYLVYVTLQKNLYLSDLTDTSVKE